MQPFNVLIPSVPDPDLGPLLTQLHDGGYDPVVTPVNPNATQNGATRWPAAGLPRDWHLVAEPEPQQSYRWPKPEQREVYTRYRVFAGTMPGGKTVHIALGDAARTEVWGQNRPYVIAFLTASSPQTPLVEFLGTDDHDESQEFISVIRGREGSKKMYDPGDVLPALYSEHFDVVTYRDRVQADGAWNKLAIVVSGDDYVSMLNHAVLQAQRRGDI